MEVITEKITDLHPDEISPEMILANALQDPMEWANISGLGRPESFSDTTGKHIFLESSAPTVGAKEGDLYFASSDNNHPYKLIDGVWTSIRDGLITSASLQGWANNLVFSSTDYDTVAWATGTIVLSNGNTYTIDAGNTGNMTAVTYIFLDTGVSSTVLQTTTTASSSVGVNRILIAVAKPNTDAAKSAEFQIFGGYGQSVVVTADVIAANTITGNEIAANTITANKLNVATLSAITADLGTITAGTITAGSSKVLNLCEGYNINGTWSVAYDAVNIRTDLNTYMQGFGSIAFDIDVSASVQNYAEILNTTMTAVDLSAYSGTGKFRVFAYIPDVTYVTELGFNWGSSGSDGWYQSVTTQANGQAFFNGWNELEFTWNSGQSFGSPDASSIVYAAFRITYSASQGDMNDCRLDFISVCAGSGAFKTFSLGTYGGFQLDDWGLRGYDANNAPATYLSALTGSFYAKQGVFENVIIKAKSGSNIWPTLNIVGYFSTMDNTTYSTRQVTLNTSENANADLVVLGYTSTSALYKVGRWKQLSTTATSAISFYNSHAGGGTAQNPIGVIKIGSYFYVSYIAAGSNPSMYRLNDDCTTPTAITLAGSQYAGSLAWDEANGYLCILASTTKIRRYTISGTTATYNSLITLDTAVSSSSPCFMYDGTYFYGYDTTNGLMRKFNSSGVQQSTLNIGETTSGLFKGLVKIQGVLYLVCESPEIMANNGYIKQQYILNLIPINSF